MTQSTFEQWSREFVGLTERAKMSRSRPREDPLQPPLKVPQDQRLLAPIERARPYDDDRERAYRRYIETASPEWEEEIKRRIERGFHN